MSPIMRGRRQLQVLTALMVSPYHSCSWESQAWPSRIQSVADVSDLLGGRMTPGVTKWHLPHLVLVLPVEVNL